jgi:hypothetical protein
MPSTPPPAPFRPHPSHKHIKFTLPRKPKFKKGLQITRVRAVEIARRCAKAKPQSYYAEPFQPHEWVLDAIMEAALLHSAEPAQSVPALAALGGECPKCHHVHMSIMCSCGCDISGSLLKVQPVPAEGARFNKEEIDILTYGFAGDTGWLTAQLNKLLETKLPDSPPATAEPAEPADMTFLQFKEYSDCSHPGSEMTCSLCARRQIYELMGQVDVKSKSEAK